VERDAGGRDAVVLIHSGGGGSPAKQRVKLAGSASSSAIGRRFYAVAAGERSYGALSL
jgi:hypothetical protein